jgi:hypothetical protein
MHRSDLGLRGDWRGGKAPAQNRARAAAGTQLPARAGDQMGSIHGWKGIWFLFLAGKKEP